MVSDGCEGTLGISLLGLCGNDFLMLSSCVVLFFIFLFLTVFYIEDNVRFRCRGRQDENFEENLNLKNCG